MNLFKAIDTWVEKPESQVKVVSRGIFILLMGVGLFVGAILALTYGFEDYPIITRTVLAVLFVVFVIWIFLDI